MSYTIEPIGVVRSTLTRREDAPRQGEQGAPEAWLEINPQVAAGLLGVEVGNELMLLTWLHLSDRSILQGHPHGDPERPLRGVFSTRSPNRPNPIGLHRVTVLEITGSKLRVTPLEAIDGTPIVDLKIVLKWSESWER